MKLTIESVDPQTRTWEGPNGPVEFIRGQFTDGSWWSLGAKPENAAERMATLTALINVEGEYEVEAKDDYQGQKQWKLKSWPGKPVYGGGGAGGGGGGRRAPSPEEQASMRASVALKAAVEFLNGGAVQVKGDVQYRRTADGACGIADEFYEWLTKTSGAVANPSQSSPTAAAPEASAGPHPPADTGVAAEAPRVTGEGARRASAPSCPACGSGAISRKGQHWKCADCDQGWEA